MAVAGKVALILVAFVVILLATAAAMEVSTGKSHSGFVSLFLITLALTFFVGQYIWRR